MESKRSRRSRDTRVGDEAVATKWAPSPSWIACPACQLLYMALHEGEGEDTATNVWRPQSWRAICGSGLLPRSLHITFITFSSLVAIL
jgi:hypothetical protein